MAQTNVTNAATLLASGLSRNVLKNKGTAAVYLGPDNTVTTANGYELAVGDALAVDLAAGETLYGIAASGTHAVHVLTYD